jgi:hypothetical protein
LQGAVHALQLVLRCLLQRFVIGIKYTMGIEPILAVYKRQIQIITKTIVGGNGALIYQCCRLKEKLINKLQLYIEITFSFYMMLKV